ILPGTVITFVGILSYAIFDKFEKIPVWLVLVLLVVTFFSTLIDNFAGALGVRRLKGSKYAFWGSIIGAIIGVIVLNLLGLIIGSFLGAIVGEYVFAKSDSQKAIKVGFASFLGFLAGGLAKFLIAFLMGLVFTLFLFF
ncbi:MAG: DUF456 family protein, partial [Candidatus Moranbacteria bacterium]|nr:DUF456 family protein [Candidatus Moranbacteria bacterium]